MLDSSRVPVAQWIERLPSKQRVVGSNPSRDASKVSRMRQSVLISIRLLFYTQSNINR
jgi:hypothetical protein